MLEPSLGVKIMSDFKDYYDIASSNNNIIGTYKRFSPNESRGKQLRWLKELGIKTIEIKAVREFDNTVKELVVYTDPTLHNGKGKHIVSLDEAKILYANYLASPFYENTDGETLKFLQVGTKRFRLSMKTNNNRCLNEGIIESMSELKTDFNYIIMQPIFSIDYISNGKGMLAIDYNPIQQLDKLGFDKIMAPEEVINEIKKTLIAYNKV